MKKITFVGDFVYNYGSGQTILGYSKAAKSCDVSISICGYIDNVIASRVPVIEQVNRRNTDIVIFVFESIMYLNPNKYPERLEKYLKSIDRKNRFVIDTDGRYGLYNEGDKTASEDEKVWDSTIKQLTDVILQPTIKSNKRDAMPFYFFGFPDTDIKMPKKKFDIAYVGNNWFREEEMTNFLKAAVESNVVKKVKIIGKDWDKYKLSRTPLDIKIGKSVLPEKLIRTMSTGSINPILTCRNLLKHKLVTPRMFETFAADTVPLFYDNFDYGDKIYGGVAKEFSSNESLMKDKIKNVIENHKKYIEFRNTARKYLTSLHSYENRMQELKRILGIN